MEKNKEQTILKSVPLFQSGSAEEWLCWHYMNEQKCDLQENACQQKTGCGLGPCGLHVQSNDITEEIPHFRYMINSKSDTITQTDTDTARAEADTILVRLNPVTTDIPNKPLWNRTIYWNSKENMQEVCIC